MHDPIPPGMYTPLERGHSIVPVWSCQLAKSWPIVPVWSCRLVQSLLVLWSWDRPLSYCVLRPPGPGFQYMTAEAVCLYVHLY
jgi:hypothetical protein